MKYTLWLLCLLFICSFNRTFAQSTKELAPGYYVVVGAYSDNKEDYAKRFVEALKSKGNDAMYGFNSSRNLYFVYLKYFTTLKEALQNMEATRKTGKFVDAWVRVVIGDIGSSKPADVAPLHKNDDVLLDTRPADQKSAAEKPVTKELPPPSHPQPVDSVGYTDVTDNEDIEQFPKMTLGNTEVFLNLFNSTNNRIVDGEVQVVDTERTRQLMKVKGNEYLLLPDPKSKSGQLTLICDVFGYRKIQNELSYPLPLADTVKDYVDLLGTTIVVTFDLVRYRKGDIATLFNVYFFNDAAVMQPDSKYELNNLLQMMKDNPNYRIRLHGHTNGNYHGKIVTLGPEKNFFTLTGSGQAIGSAKDLSQRRAETIREYLIANGIDGSRVETQAWGGKRPLYDKNSVNARRNVRVEVEVLQE